MVVVDEVVAVSVEVCAVALLKVSEVGERLHVVGLVAPDGQLVTAQVSVTVPVNELPGVTVMVECCRSLHRGLTVMLPLLVRREAGAAVAARRLPEISATCQKRRRRQ